MGRPLIPLEQKEKSQLVIDLDDIFSKFIRLFWANDNGYCQCYTCEKKIFWKYITNGHWKSRGVYQLRFDEDNCRPQCMPCNGNMDTRRTSAYEMALREELGNERVTEMTAICAKKQPYIVDKKYYIEKIIYYKKEVAKLLTRVPCDP